MKSKLLAICFFLSLSALTASANPNFNNVATNVNVGNQITMNINAGWNNGNFLNSNAFMNRNNIHNGQNNLFLNNGCVNWANDENGANVNNLNL